MRGTIIMWNGEKGIVAVNGQRHDFDIHRWKGDVPPKSDMTVQLIMEHDALLNVSPIADADLAKEKLAQLSGEGGKLAKGILDHVGKDIAISYGIFAMAALFLNMVTGKGLMSTLSMTLPGVLNGMGNANGGSGLLLVWLAVGSIVVPYFWKHKYASLAFLTPLVLTLYADIQLYRVYSAARDQMNQFSSMMGGNRFSSQMMEQVTSSATPFELGMGAYATLAVAGYLGFRGVMRYLKSTAV